MKAFILAAGLGTRLRPLTETVPKPLVQIAGKPLLTYHLDHLAEHGITEVLINTHYLPEQMEEFVAAYKKKQPNGLTISTIYEPELLGSAGTIRANESWLSGDEPFLVIYSDNLTDIDYGKLLNHHNQSKAKVTIASYYEAHPEQKGIIEHDDSLVISNFIEKPQPHQITSNYANAGIYVIDSSILNTLSELDHEVLDFGHHVFPFLLKNGHLMQVYQMDETLLDIGNLENYTKAQSLPERMNFKNKKMTTTNTNRFGGERLDSKSALAKNNLLEHIIRYDFVTGNPEHTVLDIGCGSGHGSNTLAKKFKKVHGVDVSQEAIDYAKANWQEANIEFSIGDSMNMPFADNAFDVVVAFEVFEHLTDWRKFLSEIKRVLKPNGVVYLSTPNKTLYSPGTKKPINPHHVFEMTIPEFRSALSEYFTLTSLYGQRTPIYNDHFIWKIVNPILFTFKRIIPYKANNTIKLKIINWIKPELEASDIILKDDPAWLERSRFMVAVCTNNKQ